MNPAELERLILAAVLQSNYNYPGSVYRRCGLTRPSLPRWEFDKAWRRLVRRGAIARGERSARFRKYSYHIPGACP